MRAGDSPGRPGRLRARGGEHPGSAGAEPGQDGLSAESLSCVLCSRPCLVTRPWT